MSSKDEILNKVKRNIRTKYDMPDITLNAVLYSDKIAKFIEMSKMVGGDARILEPGEDINAVIRSLYPEAKNIASNLAEITLSNINPDIVEDPHDLKHLDLSVIQGEVGVAENGCVWIPQNVRQKVIYFISEYLVIVLDRNAIVNNMHEGYDTIQFNDSGFGVFISGPSKTADIEQALVVGAHGAKGVTVILK